MQGGYSRRTLLATGLVVSLTGCLTRISDQLTGRRERKTELVSTYDRGIVDFNLATEDLELAMAYEDISRSLSDTESAITGYQNALEQFNAALRMARELQEDEAIRICENAVLRTEILLDGAHEAKSAAEAAERDEREQVQQHLRQFKEYRDQARAVRMVGSRSLARALGLTGG